MNIATIQSILTDSRIHSLQKVRQDLHAHPELSEQETGTAGKVVAQLKKCNPQRIIEGIGGHGVAAIFDSSREGPAVLFRAELDGLPIQETNEFPYKSRTEGVSHKCGHDGHMTVLLGLAEVLAENPPAHGKIILLFQPAEENGKGAAKVLKDPLFSEITPDYVFAFHNLPGYPLNEIVVKEGTFTAAVKSLIIRLKGKTAHAAEPEFGHNPALALAEILIKTNELSNNDTERADFSVITPIHMEMGKIYYGISAGYGELRFTIRSWTQEKLEELVEQVLQIVRSAAQDHQLGVETEFTHDFHANENGKPSVNIIRESAKANGFSINERNYPFKWGEDFGLFTQKFKGAMFGIGSGIETPALHNPDYDFPDELIPVGVRMFHHIASQITA